MVDVVVALGVVDGDGAADATAVFDQLGVEALERGAVNAAVEVLDVRAVHSLGGALERKMRSFDTANIVRIVINSLFKDVVEDGLELGEAAAGHVGDPAECVAVTVDSQAGDALSGRSRQGDKTVETHCS